MNVHLKEVPLPEDMAKEALAYALENDKGTVEACSWVLNKYQVPGRDEMDSPVRLALLAALRELRVNAAIAARRRKDAEFKPEKYKRDAELLEFNNRRRAGTHKPDEMSDSQLEEAT